jgi:copper chaperone
MSTPSTTHEFNVQGMSCQHCVRAVTQAVQDKDPQAQVQVTLLEGKLGRVSVTSDQPRALVQAAIEEEGYAVMA